MIAILALLACSNQVNVPIVDSTLISSSRQVVLVTTDDWNSITGKLCLLERDSDGPWRSIDGVIPVTVGKNGMARTSGTGDQAKREGDGRAPAGTFTITSAFGYASPDSVSFISMPYIHATDNRLCVDDPKSTHYNHIIDAATIGERDWSSAETMLRDDHMYKWGLVVDYNTSPPMPGKGSCIFLHLWKAPGTGTSGCTAMSEENMIALLKWLDPKKRPVLLQLPRSEYERAAKPHALPALQ